jgi:hypothetical protein
MYITFRKSDLNSKKTLGLRYKNQSLNILGEIITVYSENLVEPTLISEGKIQKI